MRAVEQHPVAVPGVESRDHHGPVVDQICDVAHEALVEDGIDQAAIVGGQLRKPSNPCLV